MTFKEFTAWCNERACDGRWGMVEAMVCIDLMAEIRKLSFWKREKFGGSCMKSVFWMKLSSQSTKRSSSTNSPPEYRILTKQSHTKRSILP